jgi:hypothetical protein
VNLRKVRNGELIAALGGVVLIASLFMPWYGSDGTSDSVNAWQAFGIVHVILLVCGLFGPLLLVLHLQQKTAAVPLAIAGLGAWLALLAIALVLLRGLAFTPLHAGNREWGILVALAAAAALFVGCWRSIGDERIRLKDGRWSKPAGGALPEGIEVKSAGPGASAESS